MVASPRLDKHQVIGAAYAKSLDGPWTRMDKPLLEPTEKWECGGVQPPACGVSNPAVLVDPADGSALMIYRGNQDKGMGIATAPSWRGPWTRRRNGTSIVPVPGWGNGLEDMYVWRNPPASGRPGCHMVLHQEQAGPDAIGAHMFTTDPKCISGWRLADPRPSVAYGPRFKWDNGTVSTYKSRERPQLLLDNAGAPTHLSNGIITVGWSGPSFTLVAPINASGWK